MQRLVNVGGHLGGEPAERQSVWCVREGLFCRTGEWVVPRDNVIVDSMLTFALDELDW